MDGQDPMTRLVKIRVAVLYFLIHPTLFFLNFFLFFVFSFALDREDSALTPCLNIAYGNSLLIKT